MRISGFAHALPRITVSAEEVAGWTGADAAFVEEKVGFAQRRFLGVDEMPSGLAAAAIDKLVADCGSLSVERVGALVVVTQTSDCRIPHMSAQLQAMCGLPNTTACFDVSLGCSGWVYALSILRGMMAAEEWTDAILVTCDPYSKIMARSDRATSTVFGDAASATWLSSSDPRGASIGRFDFGTDGTGAEGLTLRQATSAPAPVGIYNIDNSLQPEARLYMDGRAILGFMLDRIPTSVATCLLRNDITASEVDLFIFHQASRYMLDLLRRRLNLDEARAPFLLSDTGNTVSSTIPMALERVDRSVGLAGKTVLVSGFGVGLSWATTILRFPA